MIDEVQSCILNLLGYSLFHREKPEINQNNINEIIRESNEQAVFLHVFSAINDDVKILSPETFLTLNQQYLAGIANSIRVHTEHGELHKIMGESDIPYVVLKGCASSAYYSEPDLRSMGDVDFLVYEKDIMRGIKALEKNGFERDQYEFTTNQSAYHRAPLSIWEIHKEPSGIPKGIEGDVIRKELRNIIKDAVLYERDGLCFNVPKPYHHGLILLLHKISHMTTTGIGLRHLCDWAVFESSFTNDEFIKIFENGLKSCGIWRFAQIMTLVCEKYICAPKREWAQNSAISDEYLERIMSDILSGGNFGHKDENRQREIKYLTDRKEGKLGNKNIVSQAISSLNEKVYNNFPTISRHRILLPSGWILEGGKYFGLLISGKRKNKNTSAMLKEAAERKNIYQKMKLFKHE